MPLFIPALDKFSSILLQSAALVANVASGTGSLDVPGLTVDLPRAGSYYYTFTVAGSLDVQPTTVAIGVAYSGTVTQLQAAVYQFNGGGGNVVQTSSGSLQPTSLATTSSRFAQVTGRIDVSTAGTFKLQISRAANIFTIAAGGIGWVREA